MRRITIATLLALTSISGLGCNIQDPAPAIDRQPSITPPVTTPMVDMSGREMGVTPDMTTIDPMDMTADMPPVGEDMSVDMMTPQDMSPDADMSACTPTMTADALCAAASAECGAITVDDGCSPMAQVDCGGCQDDQVCEANQCVCATAPSCPALPSCGTVMNACGEQTECLCDGANTCQTGSCQEVVVSSPDTNGAAFGAAILLRGDVMFVGAPGENARTGAVYIFERDSSTRIWKQTHRITSSSMQGEAEFGKALAFDGTTLFVGEPGFDLPLENSAGAVVTFILSPQNGQWVQTGRIQSQNPDRRDNFGAAIALEGDWLFVGKPSDVNEGSVDVFKRNGPSWDFSTNLLPRNSDKEETLFGSALASDGAWLAVGEPEGDNRRGVVHLYSNVSGSWEASIALAADGLGDGFFGSAVALEDERLLVGAPEAGNDGLVLSYHYDTTAMTWVQNNNLDIPGQGFRQGYGVSVALSGGRAFTGMEFGALPAVLGVHGFVYDNSSKKWGHKHLYQPMSPVSRYGSVLAADGNTLAVGSPTETVNGSNAGVVYIHDIFF